MTLYEKIDWHDPQNEYWRTSTGFSRIELDLLRWELGGGLDLEGFKKWVDWRVKEHYDFARCLKDARSYQDA